MSQRGYLENVRLQLIEWWPLLRSPVIDISLSLPEGSYDEQISVNANKEMTVGLRF